MNTLENLTIPAEDVPYVIEAVLFQINTYNVLKEQITPGAAYQSDRLKQFIQKMDLQELCRESVHYDTVRDLFGQEGSE